VTGAELGARLKTATVIGANMRKEHSKKLYGVEKKGFVDYVSAIDMRFGVKASLGMHA